MVATMFSKNNGLLSIPKSGGYRLIPLHPSMCCGMVSPGTRLGSWDLRCRGGPLGSDDVISLSKTDRNCGEAVESGSSYIKK